MKMVFYFFFKKIEIRELSFSIFIIEFKLNEKKFFWFEY